MERSGIELRSSTEGGISADRYEIPMLRIALRVRLRASPPLRMTDRVQRAEWSVGEGLAPPVIECRAECRGGVSPPVSAECRVRYAVGEDIILPL